MVVVRRFRFEPSSADSRSFGKSTFGSAIGIEDMRGRGGGTDGDGAGGAADSETGTCHGAGAIEGAGMAVPDTTTAGGGGVRDGTGSRSASFFS